MTTIDMQTMRYINLLDRASRVKTRKCFVYNNTIIFAVPRMLMSQAIGPDAMHVKNLREQLGKRIKIISEPQGIGDAIRFIEDIIEPVRFKSLDIVDNTMVITSGSQQTKAALLGRNKIRLEELKRIIQDNFELELKVI